jgi:hypothetical protein
VVRVAPKAAGEGAGARRGRLAVHWVAGCRPGAADDADALAGVRAAVTDCHRTVVCVP